MGFSLPLIGQCNLIWKTVSNVGAIMLITASFNVRLSDANMELDLKSTSETHYFVPPSYLKFKQECFARF